MKCQKIKYHFIIGILLLSSLNTILDGKCVTSEMTSKAATIQPSINGLYDPDEWIDAKHYNFSYDNIYDYLAEEYVYGIDEERTINFYLKNDALRLYIAVFVADVQYDELGHHLGIIFDLDNSNDVSIGDIEVSVSELSSVVSVYEHDSQSGTDKWIYTDLEDDITATSKMDFVEGEGDVAFEISITLSLLGIDSGDKAAIAFLYREDLKDVVIPDLSTNFISIQTTRTTEDFIDDEERELTTVQLIIGYALFFIIFGGVPALCIYKIFRKKKKQQLPQQNYGHQQPPLNQRPIGKFCEKCGNPIQSAFCTNCGYKTE